MFNLFVKMSIYWILKKMNMKLDIKMIDYNVIINEIKKLQLTENRDVVEYFYLKERNN